MSWKHIDRLGCWLADRLGATVQLRIGILCVLGSLPFFAWCPFSGEPPLIYTFSVLALTLTGAGLVISAQVLLKQERQDERQPDEIAEAVIDRLRAEGII